MLSNSFYSRNLVDPASCHMLVSRTKPCKCESTRDLSREVCVRLIKRFIVYPTKDVHLPPQRDNFANCKANTCKKNLVPSKQEGDLDCLLVVRGALRRNKNQRRVSAATTVEAGECRESVRMDALLDEFTTYQVEGSIVDYLALDG